MKTQNRNGMRSAFSLIELMVVIAIIALLVGILAPSMSEARRSGRKVSCDANLRGYGTALSTYANDFKERFATYSWTPSTQASEWPELNEHFNSYTQAAANQAIDLIRRLDERDDIQPIEDWAPNMYYSHLILSEYLQQRALEPVMACPEDQLLGSWQETVDGASDPGAAWESLGDSLRPTPYNNANKRWPYGSSYHLISAAYSADMRQGARLTVSQNAEAHFKYLMGDLPLSGRRMTDVSYPQQKVIVFDDFVRHFGKRQLWHAYSGSRQGLLFADGSVSVRSIDEANEGFRPNSPQFNVPTSYYYKPRSWEPPTRSGAVQEIVKGYFQWTRGGLRGVDYSGSEIRTGNPIP
jgi:prepilin-type N-terminal cleavage/methylation domain-containing protein